MKINTYVELKSFLGTQKAKKKVSDKENYWILIGEKGKIISEEKNRVLVLFNKNIDNFNLENHNPQKNSLWINKADLKLDKTAIQKQKLKEETEKKSSLMNNSKWRYFFEIIDSFEIGITASIKLIGDNYIRTNNISGYSNYIISDKYLEMCGAIEFKKFEWIKIPEKIEITRKNRDAFLEPSIINQPIKEIAKKLENGKKISFELENEELTIYGYK